MNNMNIGYDLDNKVVNRIERNWERVQTPGIKKQLSLLVNNR